MLDDLTPINRELLRVRDALQQRIDDWHGLQPGGPIDHEAYVTFLKDIGYLQEPSEPFLISTGGVDPEIAEIAGPQLVVPVSNARFALNAANARWGSLYDALYGTDVIPNDDGKEAGKSYNPTRGAAVIAYAATFLDRVIPLKSAVMRTRAMLPIAMPTVVRRNRTGRRQMQLPVSQQRTAHRDPDGP